MRPLHDTLQEVGNKVLGRPANIDSVVAIKGRVMSEPWTS